MAVTIIADAAAVKTRSVQAVAAAIMLTGTTKTEAAVIPTTETGIMRIEKAVAVVHVLNHVQDLVQLVKIAVVHNIVTACVIAVLEKMRRIEEEEIAIAIMITTKIKSQVGSVKTGPFFMFKFY